ncbi:MAG: sigma 54-interacting transcriptional regulator [Kofleriaceae bacterium]
MAVRDLSSLEETPSYEAPPTSAYVVVVEGARSWRHPLERDGRWTIGRGDGCELRLDEPAASRRHAELRVVGGVATVVDLDSHNGTAVNGERLTAAWTLTPGDVVTICACTLTYHAPVGRRQAPQALGREAFHTRLAGEVERAIVGRRRLGGRVVQLPTTAAVDAARLALAQALRASDAYTVDGAARLVAMLPEVGGDEVAARALAVLAAVPDARAGAAIAPAAAVDVGVLLAAARDAAAGAPPGSHAEVASVVRRLEVGAHRIVLADPAMLRLYALVERIASSPLPVLVLGETGVGKESIAAALHAGSSRREHPLVEVNCAALPDTLAESTLFGHERGAFSGAVGSHVGRFEAAHGGTLFLDEVGELSMAVQAKLLRALDGHAITRLGSSEPRTVDVRVVAATNRDLLAEVAAGRFREDLYFRLGGAIVRVPPLRERPRELPVLAREFLAQACARQGRAVPELSVRTMDALARHPWPGNVRELRHAMDFVGANSDGAEVEAWQLPASIVGAAEREAVEEVEPAPPPLATSGLLTPSPSAPSRFRPIAEELRDLERRRMVQALTVAGGVQTRAAELLRMPRRTFVAKMREYELHGLFPRTS